MYTMYKEFEISTQCILGLENATLFDKNNTWTLWELNTRPFVCETNDLPTDLNALSSKLGNISEYK